MPISVSDYVAPSWCPGGHLQTVLPARFMPRPRISYRREKVEMPDGDFMLWDWSEPEPLRAGAPVLVHFHGLEGSSRSHYAEALMAKCAERGWRGVVAHFRSCGGELNRLPRAYFAGDSSDCEWVLKAFTNDFRMRRFTRSASVSARISWRSIWEIGERMRHSCGRPLPSARRSIWLPAASA